MCAGARLVSASSLWESGSMTWQSDHAMLEDPEAEPMKRGINVIGPLSADVGIGAAGRSTLQILARRHIPHVAVDIQLGMPTSVEPIPDSTPRASSLKALPYSATVVEFNPETFDTAILRWQRRTGYDMAPTVNAIVPFWELPLLPAEWLPILQGFDVVLAPTKFIREATERSVLERLRPLILDYPQVVHPPALVEPDRTRWLGERSRCTTFLSTFDILSEIERKNPWASIKAFQRAFVDRGDVSLVIKVNHARSATNSDWLTQLQGLADADHRIRLMTDSLTREDLWSLYASIDAYVSLHRAEGLGLGLMEAMSVGKPVVATAWSGNMDFMNAANSMLVGYELVPVSGTSLPIYQDARGQKWAEPDAEEAMLALRALADHPQLMARLGSRAAEDMRRRVVDPAYTDVLEELLAMADAGAAATREHSARMRAVRRYMRSQTVNSRTILTAAKRTGVRMARALGLKAPAPATERRPGPPPVLS